MKKVAKILFNILCSIITFIIILPIVVSLALSLNYVQNYILKKATAYATKYVGSDVHIGAIEINNIYNIELNDVYIKDPLLQDTMLLAEKINVRIGGLGLNGGNLIFDNPTASNGFFRINQYKNGKTNIAHLVAVIRGNNTQQSDTKVIFNNIGLSDFMFQYRQYENKSTEKSINFTDMSLKDIKADLEYLEINKGIVTGKINSISLRENDNVNIKSLSSSRIYIAPDKMRYDDVNFKLGNSDIYVNHYEMVYNNWDMTNFENKVRISVDVRSGNIDFADVAEFTRKERKWKSLMLFSGTFNGTVNNFKGRIHSLKTLNTTITNTNYSIKDIQNIDNMSFNINAEEIQTNTNNIHAIANDFATEPSLGFINELDIHPDIIASGSFKGKLNDFNSNLTFNHIDSKGSGSAYFAFKKSDNTTFINADVNVKDLTPNELYMNKSLEPFKNITGRVVIDGNIDSETKLNIKTYISYINIFENDISNIALTGKLKGKSITVDCNVDDNDISGSLNGAVYISNNKPTYNAFVSLKKANLNNLGVIKTDSLLNVSAKILLNGSGIAINDVHINSKVDDLILQNSKDTLVSKKSIDIEIKNSATQNNITLKSEFVDFTFLGGAKLESIKEYINESIVKYLPVIAEQFNIKKPEIISDNESESQDLSRKYIAEINLKEPEIITSIFVPHLTVAKDTRALIMIDPYNKSYSINVNSKFIAYKENMVSNVILNSMNKGDSMTLYVSAHEILFNNMYFPNVSIINNIYSNKIKTSVGFSNNINNSRLIFKSTGKVSKQKHSDEIDINIKVEPSHYRFNGKQWDITSGSVNMSKDKIYIDSLQIQSTGESLFANGSLSKSSKDSLNIELHNFNISPISGFLKNIKLDLDGQTSGKASIVAALAPDKEIIGELSISDLSINEAKLPDSNITMLIDPITEENTFSLKAIDSDREFINCTFLWEKNQFDLNLLLKDFNPILISPFLVGIANSVNGIVDADINISNKNKTKKALLNGDITIKDFNCLIDYTNVKYRTSGFMSINNNKFTMSDSKVFDSHGGEGKLDIMLNIAESGFKFDIDIEPKELLAFNTQQKHNPLFYGTVYATGDVTINNNAGYVALVANAKTEKNSKFYLPLSHNSNISNADYIKFAERETVADDRTVLWDKYKNKSIAQTANNLDIRLDIDITENTDINIIIDPISGSVIDGVGNGKMLIHVNPSESIFKINGEYIISKGTYKFIMPKVNLVSKLFTISNGGWIRFDGDPMNATINVDALYKLKASLAPLMPIDQVSKRVNVDCRMTLKDNLMKPNIELNVDVPNADPEIAAIVQNALNTQEAIVSQFMLLLITNSFMASETNSQGNEDVGADIGIAGGVTIGVEFLNSRINEIIATDKVDFSINYKPKSVSEDIISSDELSLGISTPLYKDKVFLDVQGNFNFMNYETSVSDNVKPLSGELQLTWIINDSNLRLKGFTRVIDTFDINLGLQEAGVGVYYKAEFNTIEELINKYKKYLNDRRIKKKEKRKAREKKRALKDKKKQEKQT